jgi:hypothetical protein
MKIRRERLPFIVSQGMRLLAQTDQPKQYLQAQYFRAGRGLGPSAGQQDTGEWLSVDRHQVAANHGCRSVSGPHRW